MRKKKKGRRGENGGMRHRERERERENVRLGWL